MARIKMGMKPIHPGVFFKEEILDALGVTVKDAAIHLGVRRATVSDFIHGHSSLTSDMAARIEAVFGRFGASAKSLLGYQNMIDVYEAEQVAKKLDLKRYEAA
jgi:addiction module HigA family antidote